MEFKNVIQNRYSCKDFSTQQIEKEKLMETAMAFATKVYEEAAKKQQENQGTKEETSEKKDDNVVDAEYVEK